MIQEFICDYVVDFSKLLAYIGEVASFDVLASIVNTTENCAKWIDVDLKTLSEYEYEDIFNETENNLPAFNMNTFMLVREMNMCISEIIQIVEDEDIFLTGKKNIAENLKQIYDVCGAYMDYYNFSDIEEKV